MPGPSSTVAPFVPPWSVRATLIRQSIHGRGAHLRPWHGLRVAGLPGPHPGKYAARHRWASATTTDTWPIAAVCRVSGAGYWYQGLGPSTDTMSCVCGTEPRAAAIAGGSPCEESDAAEL